MWTREEGPRGSALDGMAADGNLASASLIELFTRLVAAGHEIEVLYVTGHRLEVDNPADLAQARSFL